MKKYITGELTGIYCSICQTLSRKVSKFSSKIICPAQAVPPRTVVKVGLQLPGLAVVGGGREVGGTGLCLSSNSERISYH